MKFFAAVQHVTSKNWLDFGMIQV